MLGICFSICNFSLNYYETVLGSSPESKLGRDLYVIDYFSENILYIAGISLPSMINVYLIRSTCANASKKRPNNCGYSLQSISPCVLPTNVVQTFKKFYLNLTCASQSASANLFDGMHKLRFVVGAAEAGDLKTICNTLLFLLS